MTNTEAEQQEMQTNPAETPNQPKPEKTPSEFRRDRISNIDREISQFNYKATSHEEIQELQNQREIEYQNKMKDFGDLSISDESKELIRIKMVDDVIGLAQDDDKKFNELQKEKQQLGKIDLADTLISEKGGVVDLKTDSYKNFNPNKFERFLIQKGSYFDKEAVFKIGELSRDEETVKTESRNLKLIENANVKNGQSLDVHFVKQIGDLFKNEQMIGLATEYLQDNQELKNSLSVQQKTEAISQVIENLQKLNVTTEALESGLPSYDGKKMASESKYWAQKLATEGLLDDDTAKELADIFDRYGNDLNSEELVFCHGDCHGDNIFLNINSSGELETSLIDFEGLRISNKYHDWCEILNKSEFLRSLAQNQPDVYGGMQKAVERAWLDPSIQYNEDEIIDNLTGNDNAKKINFRLTKIYDMLSRMMTSKKNNPLEKERTNLYRNLIKSEIQKIQSQ